MLAARRTRNLRGSFRPRLPWTEKRSGRFRNYRPERSTFQCSRTATTNRSTHIIPHGSGKRRSRRNLRNQEDFAARNEYRIKDLPTLLKTRRDLPEIGRFSSRRECLRSLCWSLSFCAEANHQVSRMRHGTRAFPPCSALQFDENCRLSGRLGAYFCTRGSQQACLNATASRLEVSLRSLNLSPFLTRGFARRAFRLFAPARFLQGFCELQERTEGGICACPAKCCRKIPQKHGNTAMRFLKRLGKRA